MVLADKPKLTSVAARASQLLGGCGVGCVCKGCAFAMPWMHIHEPGNCSNMENSSSAGSTECYPGAAYSPR